jgi:hypothetical protein
VSSQGRNFVVRRGQTAVPNRTIYDRYKALGDDTDDARALSIQALGVLLLGLSRPDTAAQGYRAFLGRGLGRDGLLKALKELNLTGHRHQFKRNGPGGHMVTDTLLSEVPLTEDKAQEEWAALVAAMDADARQAAKDGAAQFARQAQIMADELAERDAADAARACQALAAELAAEAAGMPGRDRAPENGASASEPVDNPGSPCAGLPAYGEAAHLSVPDSKVSKETSSFIDRDNQANDENSSQELPPQSGAAGVNDAAKGKTKTPFGLTEEQISRNSRGAAMARAALRGELETKSLRSGHERSRAS